LYEHETLLVINIWYM